MYFFSPTWFPANTIRSFNSNSNSGSVHLKGSMLARALVGSQDLHAAAPQVSKKSRPKSYKKQKEQSARGAGEPPSFTDAPNWRGWGERREEIKFCASDLLVPHKAPRVAWPRSSLCDSSPLPPPRPKQLPLTCPAWSASCTATSRHSSQGSSPPLAALPNPRCPLGFMITAALPPPPLPPPRPGSSPPPAFARISAEIGKGGGGCRCGKSLNFLRRSRGLPSLGLRRGGGVYFTAPRGGSSPFAETSPPPHSSSSCAATTSPDCPLAFPQPPRSPVQRKAGEAPLT